MSQILPIIVNVAEVIKGQDVPSVIVRAGQKIIEENGYISPEDFLKWIPKVDLEMMIHLSSSGSPAVKYAYLFGMLFATSSGDSYMTTENVDDIVMRAWEYLQYEDLARMGYGTIDYSKITFGDDFVTCFTPSQEDPPSDLSVNQ